MIFGYARVSTQDQNLDLQTDALERAGCQKLFTEKASGAKTDRPQLQLLLEQLRSGDTLMVWKLDRLGRSLRHLIDIVHLLEKSGVEFVSLQDNINTSTASGRLYFNLMASLAEFERSMIQERVKAGLTAARARGNKGGRKAGLSKKAEQIARLAESLYNDKKPVREICTELGIGSGTLYRYLRHRGLPIQSF